MRSLARMSIRHKLTLIAMTSTGAALLLAGAALVTLEVANWKPQLLRGMASMADLVGANSTAALTFEDRDAAREVLAALRSQRNITAACLYDHAGREFARYTRTGAVAHLPAEPGRAGAARVALDHAEVFRPVVFEGQPIGIVYLESDLAELDGLVRRTVTIVVVIVLLSALAAYLLAWRLQRVISRPVLALAETARAVSSGGDYALRAPGAGDDEVGQLVVGFNHMLEQIQQRDDALEHHRGHLEAEVARRTEELVRSEQLRVTAEAQRAHSQRLESIGQLAAGIAHEINTPLQYVGDSLCFVKDAFGSLVLTVADHRRMVAAARCGPVPDDVLEAAERSIEERDLDYVQDSVPKALQSATDGIARVAEIVRAMKQFSHPGAQEMAPDDLNETIRTTVTVARNEWKYVAELTADLDPELPPVRCRAGEVRQVLLNLIVNAAHAIADVVGKDGGKGRIVVSTRSAGPWAEIRVGDTGSGIPEAIRHRIFDPFFTTKEVGRGTGQGLAIVHGIVVTGHGGSISFETETGRGTTFVVRLPIDRPQRAAA